jgi:transcriptional regulator with XRE-family HTH domain
MAVKSFTPATRESARLLGLRVRLGRLEKRWTIAELAQRVGVSERTIANVERGDLGVALGTALEAAVVVGVALFHPDDDRRRLESARVRDYLTLLPRTVRPGPVDDDF